eukprot:3736094-Rhodomonas_salina.1
MPALPTHSTLTLNGARGASDVGESSSLLPRGSHSLPTPTYAPKPRRQDARAFFRASLFTAS